MKTLQLILTGLLLPLFFINAQDDMVIIDGHRFYVNSYDFYQQKVYVLRYMETIVSGLKGDCEKYFEQKEKAYQYSKKIYPEKMEAWSKSKYAPEGDREQFKDFMNDYWKFRELSEKKETKCYNKRFIKNAEEIEPPKH